MVLGHDTTKTGHDTTKTGHDTTKNVGNLDEKLSIFSRASSTGGKTSLQRLPMNSGL